MNRLETNTKDEIGESISNMTEEMLESVKGGIDELVDSRTRELEDRKRRELNLTVFNLPEKTNDDGAVNKQADEADFKNICSRLGLDNVNIVTAFRLGRKSNHKIRPLKVILSDKSHSKFLLDNARFIPNKLPVKWQKVVIIRDLTPVQRQERKDRFEARRGQQAAAPPPRHPPSPAAMEIEAREPSPIRTLKETLSQVNATPAHQGRDPFNETTQLESTIIGGHQLGLYDDDPGSPV